MDVSRTDLYHNPARWDERAFEALFLEHYPGVYGVLFRLTGDAQAADDLTAETFWRLWDRPPARQENLSGWLYRVATHLGYNALRAEKRRSVYETAASLNAPPLPDPARALELREERQRVRDALRQLPLRDVQLLTLRHAGLAYREIAAVVGAAPGSIGTLLARAEARFTDLFRKGENDAPEP